MAKKFAKTSRTQLIEIHKLLESCLTKVSDGVVEYKEGWSDAKVAAHLGVSNNAVGGARLELFGKLRVPAAHTADELRAEIKALQEKVSDLQLKYDCLVDSLVVNRVVDVKHLHSAAYKGVVAALPQPQNGAATRR